MGPGAQEEYCKVGRKGREARRGRNTRKVAGGWLFHTIPKTQRVPFPGGTTCLLLFGTSICPHPVLWAQGRPGPQLRSPLSNASQNTHLPEQKQHSPQAICPPLPHSSTAPQLHKDRHTACLHRVSSSAGEGSISFPFSRWANWDSDGRHEQPKVETRASGKVRNLVFSV